MPRLIYAAFLPVLAALSAAPALAQETPTAAQSGRDPVLSFAPADFASSRPNTALDMINRLPGFTLDGGDAVRGFAGAAGNVLIDGQRPTIKTDTLQDTLSRIPISQIERVELIRGGAPGIDMQGRTVVANVVRKRLDQLQQIVSLNGDVYTRTGHPLGGWTYQASKRFGEHQVDVSLGRAISYDDSVGFGSRDTVTVPTGAVLLEQSDTEADGYVYSGRVNYKGPVYGGALAANALISTDEFKEEDHFYTPSEDQRFVSRSANDRGEIGINYTHNVIPLLDSETVILSKYAQGSGDSTGRVPGDDSLFQVRATAGESIGREVLHYNVTPALRIDSGGELAYNFRKQQSDLIDNGGPVALPASDVRVEELRGEGFLQGTWRVTSHISAEAGIRIERSTITETGDVALERSFTYPKPRLLLSWTPTASDQFRFRVERSVGQLDFQDFISSVNLSTTVLSAGNADLRPDKRWTYELAYEKHFWGKGAFVVTGRHEDITDVEDVSPFLATVDANHDGIPDDANGDGKPDQILVAGPGNIGKGTNDSLIVNFTLPFDKLGVRGGELKSDMTFQRGRVHDPLTGEKRIISGERPDNVTVTYRQDLPAQKLTAGLTWFKGWSERYYRLEEIQALDLRNYYAVYVEYAPTPAFTLRAELDNVDPYSFQIQRRIYDAPRNTGSLNEIQTEHRNSQVIAQIKGRWVIG